MKFKSFLMCSLLVSSVSTAYAWGIGAEDPEAAQAVSKMFLSSDDKEFFIPGRCYIYMPRVNAFMVGEVVKVTPLEVVFKDKGMITPVYPLQDTDKILNEKNSYVHKYIDSKARDLLLLSPISHHETSYSRTEMTAIPLDRCH